MNKSDDHQATTSQQKIANVAGSMLNGSIPYLQGAIQLEALRHRVGAYENDPDFMPFVAILSEIHSLPFDAFSIPWCEKDVKKYSEEIAASTEWAKEISSVQCQSLLRRYSPEKQIKLASKLLGKRRIC